MRRGKNCLESEIYGILGWISIFLRTGSERYASINHVIIKFDFTRGSMIIKFMPTNKDWFQSNQLNTVIVGW